MQVVERLRSCEAACELLEKYNMSYQVSTHLPLQIVLDPSLFLLIESFGFLFFIISLSCLVFMLCAVFVFLLLSPVPSPQYCSQSVSSAQSPYGTDLPCVVPRLRRTGWTSWTASCGTWRSWRRPGPRRPGRSTW